MKRFIFFLQKRFELAFVLGFMLLVQISLLSQNPTSKSCANELLLSKLKDCRKVHGQGLLVASYFGDSTSIQNLLIIKQQNSIRVFTLHTYYGEIFRNRVDYLDITEHTIKLSLDSIFAAVSTDNKSPILSTEINECEYLFFHGSGKSSIHNFKILKNAYKWLSAFRIKEICDNLFSMFYIPNVGLPNYRTIPNVYMSNLCSKIFESMKSLNSR